MVETSDSSKWRAREAGPVSVTGGEDSHESSSLYGSVMLLREKLHGHGRVRLLMMHGGPVVPFFVSVEEGERSRGSSDVSCDGTGKATVAELDGMRHVDCLVGRCWRLRAAYGRLG